MAVLNSRGLGTEGRKRSERTIALQTARPGPPEIPCSPAGSRTLAIHQPSQAPKSLPAAGQGRLPSAGSSGEREEDGRHSPGGRSHSDTARSPGG